MNIVEVVAFTVLFYVLIVILVGGYFRDRGERL